MQFSIATIVAAATMAVAHSNVTYVTEVVDVYTTYCPGPTTISHGSKTYTVTEPTTITFECPCTVTKPVITTSAVVCHSCNNNGTVVVPTPTKTPVVVPTGGAGKVAAGLVGVVGIAALAL